MKKYIPVRFRNFSVLASSRAIWITVILMVLFLVVLVVSVGLGDIKIAPAEVFKSFFGTGSDLHNLVVRTFRLPRILLAAFAGAALAVAGAILQGIIRNPLASPDIIGLTSGASLTTVGFLAIFTTSDNALTVSINWLPLASFLGALLTGILVYRLSEKNGLSQFKIVLIGIGLAAGAEAVTNLIMVMGSIYIASRANIWLVGSVNGANWPEVVILMIWFFILFIMALLLSRRLNILELGDTITVSVGSSTSKDKKILLIISTALTGGAVAFAGGIGFVGLMAPHMARKLVGSAYGALIPVSALLGAMIVMISDLIGRTLFAPIEVPAGVFSAIIGAPYFIYLLYKSRNI
ncbi:iron complex transport system permease protein [Scopulibacillus darangshiensis]|uniref:Iron complex transport system permease protein n=1 Tax=Scopulibacillus darangshiensis TaxID=442528 RepID=A0A4R2P9T4_9BACL|nr:iron ABC transporter permease [Scopulibacillus darangshiensis]TCP30635.1 iron complex transport system permease protein [Scopulibacillus darangshiensis]